MNRAQTKWIVLLMPLFFEVGAMADATTQPASIPIGVYHLPSSRYGDPFTLTMAAVRSPDEAVRMLNIAQDKGVKVLIHLAGGRNWFQNADGSFSLTKFQSQLERFKDVDFRPWIENGTLIGHMLLDEPHDRSNWGGKAIDPLTIDAAAGVSKRLFPGLPTGVGTHSAHVQSDKPYQHLDFISAQYSARRGDFGDWLKSERDGTQKVGLKLLVSLNVLHGGSAIERGRPISPENLRTILQACDGAAVVGILMWKWDPGYFDEKAVRDVLSEAITPLAQRKVSR